MDIPPPPLWQHLLLERPWPLVIALLVAALLLRYVARQRAQPRLGYVALALAVAAGGVVALAWSVTTERQHIEQQTRELIAATESPGDFDAIDRLLSPDAEVTWPDGAVWLRGDSIQRRLTEAIERYHIGEQVIREARAEVTSETTARSAVELRTATSLQAGMRIPSAWTLYWEREDPADPWRVVRVQCDSLMGSEPDRGLW